MLYRARIEVPARVPVGRFTAETFLIRDGRVLAAAVRDIDIRKSGFERFVANAAANAPLYRFLLNKWYFDEIYDAVFVRSAQAIGRFLWKSGDGTVIDGSINGVAMGIVPQLTRAAGRAQSGYVFHYAFVMVIAIAALLSWFTISGGVE